MLKSLETSVKTLERNILYLKEKRKAHSDTAKACYIESNKHQTSSDVLRRVMRTEGVEKESTNKEIENVNCKSKADAQGVFQHSDIIFSFEGPNTSGEQSNL